jgi:hypothetical protein
MKNPNETTNENKNMANEEENSSTNTTDAAGGNDEFQLTIKKLEMPVRPRGVLAE